MLPRLFCYAPSAIADFAGVNFDMKKKYVKRHNDGTIWAKGTMLNGVPDGYWEWFRKDGSRLRSGYFAKGEQTGEWTTYDRQGSVYKVTTIGAKVKKKSRSRDKS